jgi:hypothetical protein
MKHLLRFNEGINQNFDEVTLEIKGMIESTIDNGGGNFKQFVESILMNPDETKIEGLINDSDIYEFYLKYRNQIDEVLNTVKFYQSTADELNVTGLYDYVVAGTKQAILEFVKKLSE